MSRRVLVIDNDFFFVEFLADLLEDRGYDVVKAYDGKEGISKLEEGSFDFIFVDLIMPKVDGKQFIGFVRKRYPDASFPIIAMSATLIEREDNMGDIGGDYYLAKGPINEMAERVNRLVDRIEKQPFFEHGGETFLEPGKLHPRQVTGELVERLDFQLGVFESIGIGIIVIDRDVKIIGVNPSALEILNRSIGDVLNQHIASIFPPGENRSLVNALKEIVRDRGLARRVLKATLYAKEIRVIVSVLRVRGKIAGWIMAMEDSYQWVEQA